MHHRLAPTASRMATSRWPATARASTRCATLTEQTSSRSSATARTPAAPNRARALRHDGVNGRLRQRRECKGAAGIGVRIPPGERIRQDGNLRASLLERRVVPQPGMHPPLQLSAVVDRLPGGVVERLPEFRRDPSKQPGEPRRGNPDDRSSPVADRQIPADDPGIGPEVPTPRGVAENDHRARLVGFIEWPSAWERHAERGEVVWGDLFADGDPAVESGADHRSHAAVCDHGFEGGDIAGEIGVVTESHRFLGAGPPALQPS